MLSTRQNRNPAPVASLGATHPGPATSFIGIGYGCGAAWGGFRPGSTPTPSLDTRPKVPSSIRVDNAVPGALTFMAGLRGGTGSRESRSPPTARPNAICAIVIPVSTDGDDAPGRFRATESTGARFPAPALGNRPVNRFRQSSSHRASAVGSMGVRRRKPQPDGGKLQTSGESGEGRPQQPRVPRSTPSCLIRSSRQSPSLRKSVVSESIVTTGTESAIVAILRSSSR